MGNSAGDVNSWLGIGSDGKEGFAAGVFDFSFIPWDNSTIAPDQARSWVRRTVEGGSGVVGGATCDKATGDVVGIVFD